MDPQPNSDQEKAQQDAARMSLTMLYLGYVREDEYGAQSSDSKAVLVEPEPLSVASRGRFKFKSIVGTASLFLAIGIASDRLASAYKTDKPLAVVNGEKITEADVSHASEVISGRLAMQRVIEEKLVYQYAKLHKVSLDPNRVESRYNTALRDPAFFKKVADATMTPDDFKLALRVNLCKLTIFEQALKPSDEEVKDFYTKNINPKNLDARFYHPENVVIAIIVSQTKAEIDAAHAELKKGAAFDAVARKYSVHESKYRGGVLPAIAKNTMDSPQWAKFPELKEMFFDHMQVGEIVGPVKYGPMFGLILCISHTPESIEPFDKVKELCEAGALANHSHGASYDTVKKDVNQFVVNTSLNVIDPRFTDIGVSSTNMTTILDDHSILSKQ